MKDNGKTFVTAEQARLLKVVDDLERDGNIEDAANLLATIVPTRRIKGLTLPVFKHVKEVG